MPRSLAIVTQANVARVIRAAKKTGAPGVEVRMGDVVLWIPFTEPPKSADTVAQTGEIVL